MRIFVLAALVAALAGSPALAQSASGARFPDGWAPGTAVCVVQTDGKCKAVEAAAPLPVAGRQETIQLVAANTPAAAAVIYGGEYLFAQSCGAYGTITLRGRGPDQSTMYPVVARTGAASETVKFGSAAIVDVTVSGTTGCNATLSRVP